MAKTFYLAGSYANREYYINLSKRLEANTGWKWLCNSRWLDGRHEGLDDKICADDDCKDVWDADAVVLVHGNSSRGGMWCELGLAIAWKKPIVFYIPDDSKNIPIPVFAHLPAILWVYSLLDVSDRFQKIQATNWGY